MREHEVEVPGGRLFADEAGDGPPVLLLHAGVTDRRVWDATMPPLVEAGFRVIRYGVRGFGRSAPPTGAFSLVDDALAVLDALNLPSAHFVGLSQGGATSVDVALVAPERVRSLALVCADVTGYEWPRQPGYERRVAAFESGDAQAMALEIARLFAPLSFDGTTPPTDYASRIVLDQADRFMADELETELPSAIPRLPEIAVPTLVVVGDQDQATVAAIGDVLAKSIPGAILVRLDGADHLLPLRVPAVLHDLLLKHLRP